VHPVGAVVAALDFAFRIPARVVAEERDERQAASHRRFKIRQCENRSCRRRAPRTPRCLSTCAPRARRRASADGAGDAVDETAPTGSMLWPHCANSPPSQIRTVSGSRSTKGRKARKTSAGCSGGRLRHDVLPRCRPGAESTAGFGEPGGIACLLGTGGELLAAKAGSATQAKTRASPFSRFARAVSAASGSMAMTWTSAAKLGAAAHLSEKSSALPSSTTRSARFARSVRAPSVASASRAALQNYCRRPLAASSFANRSRPFAFDICGPAKMIGRFARRGGENPGAVRVAKRLGRCRPVVGHVTALSSNRASSKSDASSSERTRRPEHAIRIASPISRPRDSTLPPSRTFRHRLGHLAWRNS